MQPLSHYQHPRVYLPTFPGPAWGMLDGVCRIGLLNVPGQSLDIPIPNPDILSKRCTMLEPCPHDFFTYPT